MSRNDDHHGLLPSFGPDPSDAPNPQQNEASELGPRAAKRAAREAKIRKQQKQRKNLTVLLIAVLVLGIGGFFVTQFASDLFKKAPGSSEAGVDDYPGPGSASVEVSVNQGDSGEQIATSLKKAGVIATRQAYLSAASANAAAQGIQPGTYGMLKEMRAVDALSLLIDPANRVDYVVTVVEGSSVQQIMSKVHTVMGLTQQDTDQALADTAATGLPKAANGNYEGWLSPGQYVFPKETKPAAVIHEMVARTIATLDKLNVKKADRQNLLIKASILVKEATKDDFGKVARVISNRLATDKKLEMDTTVAFGAGKNAMDLTRADFADSGNKYNTYRHVGLPPGPIANPTVAAIEATLNPVPGPWIWYVTVNLDTGETLFTDNYADHLKNVETYRKWKAEHYTPSNDG